MVLRDTGVLRIKKDELRELTSVARTELERRQRVARTTAKAAPIAGIVLFLGGVGLIVYAAPQMRRQERKDEERSDAELQQLREKLPAQTDAERNARATEEAAAEAVASEVAIAPQPAGTRSRVHRYIEVERKVLDQLHVIASPLHEFRPQVSLGPTGTPIDGVLVSVIDQLPDVVVEIKLRRPESLTNNLRTAIDETLARVVRYRTVVAPAAIGWLIVVVDGPVPAAAAERVSAAAAEVRDDIRVSVIAEDEIGTLRLPPGPWQ